MKYFVTIFLIASSVIYAQQAYNLADQKPLYTEFVYTADANGNVTCTEFQRDEKFAKNSISAMNPGALHVLPQTVGRRNVDGTLMKSQVGLDIVLRGTDQLNANPAAVAAFAAAAARWEERMLNQITVTIDVDFGVTNFGSAWSSSNVLGSTFSAGFSLSTTTMRQFANSLIGVNPQYSNIYNNIPDTLYNTSTVAYPRPAGTLANLQALGIRNSTEVLPFGSAPHIGFNSAFTFDLNPSDGISSNQTDFDAVAVHEIGHALGFVSVIGSTGFAYTWDLFRFRPGAVKDTITFKTATRVLTPGPSSTGGDHVFWDGLREWEVSTATGSRTGGDGQQASHWRDDALRSSFPASERWIGIMDPNIPSSTRLVMTLADLKALSILGWVIDFGNLINSVEDISTQNDYKAPTAVTLKWKNPLRFYGGNIVSSYKIVVFRDNQIAKEFINPPAGQLITFIDSNLVQYKTYNYRLVPVHIPSNDSGVAKAIDATVGGSPRPAAGTFVQLRSNQSTVYTKFITPTKHDDQTTLHNLKMAKLYRGVASPGNIADSLMLTSVDTSKVYYFIDTPPYRFLNNYSYNVAFVGEAPFVAEGSAVTYPQTKGGVTFTSEYKEGFETSKSSVVSDDGWDSTNISARTGTYSFGALSYANNKDLSAYIPMIIGNGTPMLTFWSICRIEPNDSALVQVSRNRGRSWATVLKLNEDSHAEWKAGTNMWFRNAITLTGYETDSILVRFRLKSNGTTSSFGWLIDDISLSPVLTSVNTDVKLPDQYLLAQNYPNPFNPTTRIDYAIKEQGVVTITLYDLLGREITTIVNEMKNPGWYSVDFNASRFSSGVYFYKLETNNFTTMKKMQLLK